MMGLASAEPNENPVLKSLMYDQEQAEIIYVKKENKHVYAKAKLTIHKTNPPESTFELNIIGEGDFNQFKNIHWKDTTRWIEEDGHMRILKSSKRIFNQSQDVIEEYVKKFDYANQQIKYVKRDSHGKIVKAKTFSIKGPTCDDATLVHFLRVYASQPENQEFGHFYLVTNEPRYYKVLIDFKGEDLLKLPLGEIQARKFQLMADLGPLTKLASHMIAPTYVWYANTFPFQWLQYEGLESGHNTANIISYTAQISPSIQESARKDYEDNPH